MESLYVRCYRELQEIVLREEDSPLVDEILDEMDALWFKMTPAERGMVEQALVKGVRD
ncbi:hypothetical protein SCBWM1_gp74 [Synechococcus phage S-CBWM1]|uniref:Uncharacterized protein n=1 Tax=Synechococcus phage S-CBWM1 TaxID=2053653 RepID=A0A3G1L3K4_9CAUD|nr:hypothetical protein HOU61_gp123 [Synechococcus phage S-CBWM1]ATW62758.1 hypothetical protein SCBWM1_gp74 [Synechococcus phage S-CBWM1]